MSQFTKYDMKHARAAYEAYGDFVAWKNYEGKPMPSWFRLPVQIQEAWAEAAREARRG